MFLLKFILQTEIRTYQKSKNFHKANTLGNQLLDQVAEYHQPLGRAPCASPGKQRSPGGRPGIDRIPVDASSIANLRTNS